MAVDSNEYTKWLCSPFAYGNDTATCVDTCPGVPSWASDGYCDDGGPGAEYSGCGTVGTDCLDCGPRCEGGGSDCGDGATITIDFEGHHSIGSYYLGDAIKVGEEVADWGVALIAVAAVLVVVCVGVGSYALCKKTKQSVQLSSPMPVTMMVGDKKDASAADSSATDTEAVELEVKD